MCTDSQGRITRRSLLRSASGFTAGLAFSTQMPSLAAQITISHRAVKRGAALGGSLVIEDLRNVMLLPGPFLETQKRNRTYLLSLDQDRFLFYFRKTAGLSTKVAPYGGWEQNVGRMLGHYLSACSMYVRADGDPAFRERQNYIVAELAECQRAKGTGYVGGVPDADRIFAEIGKGNIYIDKVGLNGVHAPWYMLHKMCAGLRDAYVYGENEQALAVLTGFSDWAYALTNALNQGDLQKMLRDEHGGMNEVFADSYAFTGQKRYLELSRRFNRTAVLDPLMKGVDDLDGLHANTQIPTVLGLHRQFQVSGDQAARHGAEFFWETVVQNRTYVNGGNSDKEHFYPRGEMAANLSPATAETCNSYNMVKLTDRLFADQPRERLAAYNERVLWNHILPSLDHDTPGMTYYMSLKPGHFKTYSQPYDSFWCCVGTGMENHAKYAESIYFSSGDEMWINQFIASRVLWKDKDLQVSQETQFPQEQFSRWTVSCKQPQHATFYVRHPTWAGERFHVTVNGEPAGQSQPGSYLKLQRTWHDGDIIRAELPISVWEEPMPDDHSLVALLYGPLVLAGLLGTQEMPATAPYASSNQLLYKSVVDPAVPHLKRSGKDAALLRQTGLLRFEATSASDGNTIPFAPFVTVTRERYSVYWKTT